VNENWHPGWHASEGTVVNGGGLLAVDLLPGVHDVVLRFLPRSALVGAMTSLAALLVALYVWRITVKRDGFGEGRELAREALVLASPLCVAALGLVVLREPKRPPPSLFTPDGEPIVLDAPPSDVTPVGARWVEEGITLEAVQLRQTGTTDKDAVVTVELDWRFDKPPPPRLAVTLRIPGGPEGQISRSYAFLSGALLIDDAPLHKTVRDVSESILLPRETLPHDLRLSVSLSYLRGGGEPVTDVETGGGHAEDGRVILGPFIVH
jgi:hypothetical protein